VQRHVLSVGGFVGKPNKAFFEGRGDVPSIAGEKEGEDYFGAPTIHRTMGKQGGGYHRPYVEERTNSDV